MELGLHWVKVLVFLDLDRIYRHKHRYLLGHLLLLFLPLTGLQVHESIDLFFFRLRIVQLQDVIADCTSPSRCSASGGRFDARGVAGIDGHFPGDISSGAAFAGSSCRQSAGNDRG